MLQDSLPDVARIQGAVQVENCRNRHCHLGCGSPESRRAAGSIRTIRYVEIVTGSTGLVKAALSCCTYHRNPVERPAGESNKDQVWRQMPAFTLGDRSKADQDRHAGICYRYSQSSTTLKEMK